MVEIILERHKNLPEAHIFECTACRSIILTDEYNRSLTCRNEDVYEVNCPVCNNLFYNDDLDVKTYEEMYGEHSKS